MAETQVDVWRFCAHLVDVSSADDLAQDTYLRALGSVHRFRGDASARSWLLAIARHACADELRRRTRRRRRERPVDPADLDGDDPAHGDGSAGLGLPADLVAAIDDLDQDRREAFVMTQVLGLSYREAAASAEVPIGTIRSRVARARTELVAALGEGRHVPSDGARTVTNAATPPPPGRRRTRGRPPRRRGA